MKKLNDYINLIDLRRWKKQKDILLELSREYAIHTTAREWRAQVERWNKRFANGEVDTYITHSNSLGFKATNEYSEAKIGRDDYMKRAVNMFQKARECDKAFKQHANYQMDFEKGELV